MARTEAGHGQDRSSRKAVRHEPKSHAENSGNFQNDEKLNNVAVMVCSHWPTPIPTLNTDFNGHNDIMQKYSHYTYGALTLADSDLDKVSDSDNITVHYYGTYFRIGSRIGIRIAHCAYSRD